MHVTLSHVMTLRPEPAYKVATLGHRNLYEREDKTVEIEGIAEVGRRETIRH